MAEERTLGLARASSARDEEEPGKEELQRRMEEARESITQTVTEIKETVTNQYYSVKETVSDALDWRHHFRQRPIAFGVGALSVGFLVGYSLGGALKGDGSDRDQHPSYEGKSRPAEYEGEPDEAERHTAFHGHSYAAQPITDSISSDYEMGSSSEENRRAEDSRQPQGGSYSFSPPGGEKPIEQKASLLERFKETSAYDRLQSEVSSLGDRFIDELATTAHKVVLPALFNKIKELFGVDLSDKQAQGTEAGEKESTGTGAKPSSAHTASMAASGAASPGSGGSSYGTSENRGYGAQSSAGERSRSGNDSVLDLDR